jgi:hypothetical protein
MPNRIDDKADDSKIAAAQAYVRAINDLKKAVVEYGTYSPEASLGLKQLRKARDRYLAEVRKG